MNDFYYLSHGGPGSGRYPLGSGDRPYQKFEGSGGRGSGLLGYIRSRKAKKSEERLDKQMKETAEKRKRHVADKERVLREGSATEVLRYQGELTNQELQNAYTRLNLESQLKNISQREIKTNVDKIDNLMKTVRTGTEWVKIGTDAYNTMASIYNTTPDGRKKPLPVVKSGGGDKKK